MKPERSATPRNPYPVPEDMGWQHDTLRRCPVEAWPCLWPECVGGPDSACYGKTEPCKGGS